MASPKSALAAACASSATTARLRSVIRSTSAATSGAATPGSRTMDPVGTGLVDTTAVVVSGEA
jgi:hypothetical protein